MLSSSMLFQDQYKLVPSLLVSTSPKYVKCIDFRQYSNSKRILFSKSNEII